MTLSDDIIAAEHEISAEERAEIREAGAGSPWTWARLAGRVFDALEAVEAERDEAVRLLRLWHGPVGGPLSGYPYPHCPTCAFLATLRTKEASLTGPIERETP
jgi:hypothetical protein